MFCPISLVATQVTGFRLYGWLPCALHISSFVTVEPFLMGRSINHTQLNIDSFDCESLAGTRLP